MTESPSADPEVVRAGLMDSLRACRALEREIFAALDPVARDAPGPDDGWSAKDELAHLSAWRRRQALRMAAAREGRPEPSLPEADIDGTNAIFHAERADWPWATVDADADATADGLVAEIAAAEVTALTDRTTIGQVMGDGTEHDLGHLSRLAAMTGHGDRVLALAAATQAMVSQPGWPATPAAYARYNLACFHALGGRLDEARSLLRLALPADASLREHAPSDPDLAAIRDELPGLVEG